jgi:hypothetical protein
MASTIQLKTGTGSAIPSALAQGEVGINIDNGLIYYGSGSGNIVKQLESFTHITASGNISASGGGTHVLGGNLEVYGSIRSIGSDVTLENGNITISGDISGSSTSTSSFGHIITEGETIEFRSAGTKIGQLKVDDTTGFSFDTGDGSDRKPVRLGVLNTKSATIDGNVTASNNISSSGTVIANGVNVDIALTFAGNTINPKRILYDSNEENLVVQDSSLRVNSHITASGDISASGTIVANNIEPTNRTFTYGTTAGHYSGDVVSFGNGPGGTDGDIVQGELYYLSSSQNWEKTDADATGTATNMLGIAVADDTPTFLVKGIIANAVYAGFTTGAPLYVHTTAGDITGTAPSGTGDIVRIVGHSVNGTNRVIYFNPSNDFIVHA